MVILVLGALVAVLVTPATMGAQTTARDSSPDAPPFRTGHAALDGVVRDTLGRPLAHAVISAEAAGRTVLTNDAGRFRIERLPADTVDFSVRRVGYAPAYFAVTLVDSATVSIAVKMLPAAVELGKVIIEGKRRDVALVRTGFYDRLRRGRGVFFDGDRLERYGMNPMINALRNTSRVRLTCSAMGCFPIMLIAGRSCAPALYLDGMKIFAGPGDFETLFGSAELAGVEVYRDPNEVPFQFSQPFGRCGAIVAWTTWNQGR